MEFRTLRADEIECRVGMIKDNGFSLLLYKDARCDMRILDEADVKWTRRHYECKGNLFCEVGIYDTELGQFVYRSDCGTESNTEKEKGEASDSFKRACFNWGIGRELYTSPFIWINGNVKKENGKNTPTFKSIKVAEIEYTDGKITKLRIVGDGKTIFEHGYGRQKAQDGAESVSPTNNNSTESVKPRETAHNAPKAEPTSYHALQMTSEYAHSLKMKSGKRLDELTNEQLCQFAENATNERYKAAANLLLDEREKEEAYFEELTAGEDLPF